MEPAGTADAYQCSRTTGSLFGSENIREEFQDHHNPPENGLALTYINKMGRAQTPEIGVWSAKFG